MSFDYCSEKYEKELIDFLNEYNEYVSQVSLGKWIADSAREKLQRKIPLISAIVDDAIEYPDFEISLSITLKEDSEVQDEDSWKATAYSIQEILNKTIGAIHDSALIIKEIEPILPINDIKLKDRCSYLLSGQGNFDAVINQATQVLEERLRDSVSFEKLCELLPQAKNHVGQALADRLLGGENSIVIISTKLRSDVKNGHQTFHAASTPE